MNVGAHVPTRGRPANAIDYAEAIGADTFQIFVGNPRAWAPPPISPELIEEFRERRGRSKIGPVFVHSSYLVNIASPNPEFLARSVELSGSELRAAADLGADGLVVHSGAGGRGERSGAVRRAAASAQAIAGAEDGRRSSWSSPPAGRGRWLPRSPRQRSCSMRRTATPGWGCAWTHATCSPPDTASTTRRASAGCWPSSGPTVWPTASG
jgi:deoxyribonuclease IV